MSWQRRGLLGFGRVRGGAGSRDPDRSHFPGGSADVSGVYPADRVRLRLLQAVRKERQMNIVVWKSPKALSGILRKLFHVKA